MNSWSRHVKTFPALTLLLSCVLVSACNYAVRTKTLFGEFRDQFPPVVLSVDKPDSIDYTFDWNLTTIAGVRAENFRPSNDYWRLNVYRFADGELIAGSSNYKNKKTDNEETLKNLPVGKLLRADLDLADDEQGTKGRETYSFMFLFHYE